VGFDGDALAKTSRLVAKVDSAAVQDGYDLYLHGFIVADDGAWTIVQQGMNAGLKQARRYHWLSEGLKSFVDEPHSAIEGANTGTIVNLTDRRARASQHAQVELLSAMGPDGILRELSSVRTDAATDVAPIQPELPHLQLPARHDVRARDVIPRRLHATLAAAAERGPKDFAELLLVPGVGRRTVEALAMVAEVVHGTPCRFSDPARFSLAHGGKDGHPFPVPLAVYDQTIRTLKSSVQKAKLGRDEELAALKRLDDQARHIESCDATGVLVEDWMAEERAQSHRYGGRTVLGLATPVKPGRGTRVPVPANQGYF
jgi:hypothetical protein